MDPANPRRTTLVRALPAALRLALIALFAWLVARHWHPHYGFTRFLQADADVAGKIVPALRGAPIFVHPDPGSYDGFFYAEIATDPTLRTPGLAASVDDLGYRARRILLGAIAWALGGGEPGATARAYAWLNLFVWLALAAALWRLLPGPGWRDTLAWAGVLFATGALLSVRFALTDLAALLFVTLGLTALERGRRPWIAALGLGLAGLARETALLALTALLPRDRAARRLPIAIALVVAVLPLALWLGYVRFAAGSSGAGIANFGWPLAAAAKKALALAAAWRDEPNRWLVVGSTGAFVALFVQLAYLVRRPRPADPWWRLGAAFGGLMIVLGPSVWGDDLPGAAVRVLLPLTLAFNLLAVRQRASLAWFALGNLSLLGGVGALYPVDVDAHEFAAARFAGGTYVVHTGDAFYPVESRRTTRWAWSRGSSSIRLDFQPHLATSPRVAIALSAATPQELEIAGGESVIWRGPLARESQWIDLGTLSLHDGSAVIELRTAAPPATEAAAAGGRSLAFSLGGVRVE